jgi:hypothetical protein
VPVYSYGKLVGSRIAHNDRLLMFMLKNRAPARFDAQGNVTARRNSIGNPGYANELSRLKKQWRKEWEAERLASDQRSEADTFAEIDAMIDQMRQRTLEAMSPRTRRLYEAYLESQREDGGNGRE